MTRRLLISLLVLGLSGGCAALWRSLESRPPREQLMRIPFPLPEARSKLEVSGPSLRAINLAMDDFLPPGKKAPTPADACLFQRESYDVVVVEPESDAPEAADGGASESDAGEWSGPKQQGHLLYVIVLLRADACQMGDSPLMDAGATYAIDTEHWRIVGWSL